MFQRSSSRRAARSPSAPSCAAVPLLALFVLLGGLRIRAWMAGSRSRWPSPSSSRSRLFAMPVGQALMAGAEGAAFGFFPILWIVINAIWVYNLTVVSGHFDVLRRSFEKVSPDQRIQAIIIAFCFGALLEALAGFGTPVAITVRDADGARASARQGRRRRAGRQHRARRLRRARRPDRHAGHGRLRRQRRPAASTVGTSARWSAGRPRCWRSSSRWSWSSSSTGAAACGRPGCRPWSCGVALRRRASSSPPTTSPCPADRHRRLAGRGGRASCCCSGCGSPAEVYVEAAEDEVAGDAERRAHARGRGPRGAPRSPRPAGDRTTRSARDRHRRRSSATRARTIDDSVGRRAAGPTRRTSSSSRSSRSPTSPPSRTCPGARRRRPRLPVAGARHRQLRRGPVDAPTFKFNWLPAAGTLHGHRRPDHASVILKISPAPGAAGVRRRPTSS